MQEQELLKLIDRKKIPGHVAIIMDGNGRWARERGLPRSAGHKQGVESVRAIVRCSSQLEIDVLTLFAFSTENWKRPPWEVNYLMNLPEQYLTSELPELVKNNVRVHFVGDPGRLPQQVCKAIGKGLEATRENTGMILNFALNYGSRAEITQAARKITQDVLAGKINSEFSESQFSAYLYTGRLRIPDPDLLIRTSGEYRISNFLLWQLAYSELWFTEVYWPDFNRMHLLQAIFDYQQRTRRFGSS